MSVISFYCAGMSGKGALSFVSIKDNFAEFQYTKIFLELSFMGSFIQNIRNIPCQGKIEYAVQN